MEAVADSIVVKRLVRYLQYKRTYIQVFESFLEPEPHPAVVGLLQALVSAQQAAVGPLSGYLRGLGLATLDLPLNQRLLEHAASRKDVGSRLRFAHYGLSKAVAWYKTQLMDGQMTADPELQQILFEMGQLEAARLWRVEAVLARLRIPQEPCSKERRAVAHQTSGQGHDRLSGWSGRKRRPAWGGR